MSAASLALSARSKRTGGPIAFCQLANACSTASTYSAGLRRTVSPSSASGISGAATK